MSSKFINSNNLIFSTISSLEPILSKSISPAGSFKMLHEPSTDITITKHGYHFLSSVKIVSPIASQILKLSEALKKSSNDGTISIIIFISSLIRNLEVYLREGVHPRVLFEGLAKARNEFLKILNNRKISLKNENEIINKDLLKEYCFSLLRTKMESELAEHLNPLVFNAFMSLLENSQKSIVSESDKDNGKGSKKENRQIFNYSRLIEIVELSSSNFKDSRLVRGLVLDHGPRHPFAKNRFENCYILFCSLNMELEKTEINSSFAFNKASDREEMAKAEREVVNKKVKAIIELKNNLFKKISENSYENSFENKNPEISFLVINYSGIDPSSLSLLHNNGIDALRRCKKRNLERLSRICGGHVVNSEHSLNSFDFENSKELPPFIGWANKVTVERTQDEIYTFVEEPKNPSAATLVLRGPTKAKLGLMKEGAEQALMAMMTALKEGVVKGAGNFELNIYKEMIDHELAEKGSGIEGYMAFTKAMLSVPKAIAAVGGKFGTSEVERILRKGKSNSSGERIDKIENVSNEMFVEIDVNSKHVLDGFSTKRDIYSLGTIAVQNFLLIDQIITPRKEEGEKKPGIGQ